MQILANFLVLFIGIAPFICSGQTCVSNECTEDRDRDPIHYSVIDGAEYFLDTTETVATIGISVSEFVDDITQGYPGAFTELLNATLTPALKYLGGVNDEALQPFYPDIFDLIDELFYELQQNYSMDTEQRARSLVNLLLNGADLGLDIASEILGNNTEGAYILDIIYEVLDTPGLEENLTCILTEFLNDDSIQDILGYLEVLQDLPQRMSIIRPILQVFSQSYLFESKFKELRYKLPSSDAVDLCVDAFLANLICPLIDESPYEQLYCKSLCADTLVYCTAILSQSLQDFSDVLDSVAILTVGYIHSEQFESEFEQLRQDLLFIIEGSLDTISNFDVVAFVNETLEVCNVIPLLVDVFEILPFFPPNTTNEDTIRRLIDFGLTSIMPNITIDVPYIIDEIERFLTIEGVQNVTQNIYYLPNGFLLDGILSLGVYYTLLYRPPNGCGYPYPYYSVQNPFSFIEYYSYNSDCFGGGSEYSYSCGSYIGDQCSYSFYSLYYNNYAAQRTCSFSESNFIDARIYTNTNLCTVFISLYPESIDILRYGIDFYDKLPFCRDFITPETTCFSNDCTENRDRDPIHYSVIDGAEYFLDTTETVATIGISVSEFVDDITQGYPGAFTELLNATLTPALTYLGGVNDEALQPFYPEIFDLIDELFDELQQNYSMDTEQRARSLVNLLLNGADLGLNIASEILGNNTEGAYILDIIYEVLDTPGLEENLTCILTEFLNDDSIQDILGHLEVLQDLPQRMSIIRPILQVFSQSYLFESKFKELRYALPSSDAVDLCVDAFLANLICPLIDESPYEQRYCQSLCADTLVYCTAILSQSLQDFSDVLDSVAILTVGYIHSEQFESEFEQLRQDLLFIIEGSLDTISNFDVVAFVNETLEVCNVIPLLVDVFEILPFFPPNTTNEDTIRRLIEFGLTSIMPNITIDVPYIIDEIERFLTIEGVRNVTQNIYYLPNGFLLDGILSLGVYYTLLYRPPNGCGYPYPYYSVQNPFSFIEYYSYNSDCFGGGSEYSYSCGSYIGDQCSYSFYSLYYNNYAAQRTCSFSESNFIDARIYTNTNLCTVFISLYPESIEILRYGIDFYDKLPFCRDFITPETTCFSNDCTENRDRDPIHYSVIDGAEYFLDTTETVATIGISVSEFVDDITQGYPGAFTELLNATLTPALTYLGGVNDEALQPFYPEIFDLIDELFDELQQNYSMDTEQRAKSLVNLLLNGADLGLDIASEILGNNTEGAYILDIIYEVLDTPGLEENLTCILTEFLNDDSIQDILGYLEVLQDLPQRMSIIRPILQVFSQSYLFESKFKELRYALPSSDAVDLCVDAFLANLICPLIDESPYEQRYCQSLCADTLVYCTAILSQSLQDFSDVLDSVVLLTVGYIHSEQFESEFEQLRQDLLFIIEGSLDTISNFDVVAFVNETLEVCNVIPLLVDVFEILPFFPPNTTNEDTIRRLIEFGLTSIMPNITIDVPYIIDEIERFLTIEGVRNVTQNIYYLPNGFLLDGILSLGVYYTLLYRPPNGCGYPYPYYSVQNPFSFIEYYSYNSDCFGGGSEYSYSCGSYIGDQCSYSFYSLYYNNYAAQRTCSFSESNFIDARIYTNTNLCTVFISLYPESIDILRYGIDFYDKLPFCRDFITPETTCFSNDCTENKDRDPIHYSVIDGAEYFLDTTETVATIGISVSEFVDDITQGYPGAFTELLNATLTPALTYLGGVNDEALQPFYPEIFDLIDELFDELQQNYSMDTEQRARSLVNLLLNGADLGLNIASEILGNNTEGAYILDIIYEVLDTPGLEENLTCILTEFLNDDSIQDILGHLEVLQDLPQRMSIIRPILQVFSQSNLFESKFKELRYKLPSSDAVDLCVDAFLANLICPLIDESPYEQRYCQSLCADTLVYCTAILSQSLQDFSDVLDSVAILTVGYIHSEQFESEFEQLRQDLLFIIEGSLDTISNFDVVAFVNETLEVCNVIPLLVDVFEILPFFPPNTTNEDTIRRLIDFGLTSIMPNITIDVPFIIDEIERFLTIEGVRNVTQNIYYLPNGYLLDGILSLGVYYTLLYRPPYGCGYPYPYYSIQNPFSFLEYSSYYYDCFSGDRGESYSICGSYISGQCSFSLYSLFYNTAATRTCSFSIGNFSAARIETETNLCTIFLSLYPDSRYILRDAVNYYDRLPYCREFVLAVITTETPTFSTTPTSTTTTFTTPTSTTTTPTTPTSTTTTSTTPTSTTTTPTTPTSTTTTSTTPTPTTGVVTQPPILPPIVSFPQTSIIWSVGVSLEYPCTVIGTNVEVSITSFQGVSQQTFPESETGGVFDLIFNSNSDGVFLFRCTAINEAGSVSVLLTVTVQPVVQTIEMINDVPLDQPLTLEIAQELVTLVDSIIGTDEVQNNFEQASQLLAVAALVVASIANPDRAISNGEAESLLLLLGNIGGLRVEPVGPINPDVVSPLSVSAALGLQARAAEDISNNVAIQLGPGETRQINSPNIIVIAVFFLPEQNQEISVDLDGRGESITLGNDFDSNDEVRVATARITSPLRREVDNELTQSEELNSVLVALTIFVNGIRMQDFTNNPIAIIFVSQFVPNAVQLCSFINEITGLFETGIETEIGQNGIVSCFPEHTTSFGVLIRAQEVTLTAAETLALSIVSYLLLSISLIFLVVSIILFLIAAKKFFKVEINILYFNFAFSLALATSVFIFGIQTARNSIAGCSIVAFLLHYFWLSVFSWSFAISLFMIYILYIGVFQRRRIWWIMMIIGWGLPLPFVIITAAVGLSRNDYAVIGDHCFISYNNGLLWGFFVPFLLLLVATTVAAVFSVVKIFLTIRAKGDKADDFDAMKKTALALIVLLPILSVPWILGIINVFITSFVATTIIEWVTILLTAPTGVAFFFLVVLRNSQIQEVIFRRKSVLPPTSSQTSGGISSKFTLPNKARESSSGTLPREKEQDTAIINPAYETPKQVDIDKDTAKQATATENLYAARPEKEKDGDGKAYESLLVDDDTIEKESPIHQYSQLSKDD